MNNGYFPPYFGHPGLGGPPGPPHHSHHHHHLDPAALSSWAANPHLAAAAMAHAAAAEQMRSNQANHGFHPPPHHVPNPFLPPSLPYGGGPHHLPSSSSNESRSAVGLVKPSQVMAPSSVSSWSSRLSDPLLNTSSSHMFNTGLPPLDRQGLFPSHGSILDPLQTPASAPPPISVKKPPEKPHVTVNLTGESDEEVLVDDFDGQCCRTYPDNHSKILKWRAEKARKGPTAAAVTVVTTTTSTTVVKTTSLVSRKPQESGTKTSAGPSSGGSAIPVGIAIGRQRQQPGPGWHLPSPTGSSGCGATGSAVQPPINSLVTPSRGAGATPMPSPSSLHHPHQWLPSHLASPAGPIPMGYQLAKDPLTGQILLIPTDPTQPPHASSQGLWPPPHHPHLPHGYGVDGRLPPGVLDSHYHQLYYQQQQQHLRYLQGLSQQQDHHHLRLSSLPPRPTTDDLGLSSNASSSASSSLAKMSAVARKFDPSREPETITVSDDDDEAGDKIIPKPKESSPKIPPEESPVNLAQKPTDPAPTKVEQPLQPQNHSDFSVRSLTEQKLSVPKIKEEPHEDTPEATVSSGIDDLHLLVAESLVELAHRSDPVDSFEGNFETLLKGIELHEDARNGIDMICAVTHEESCQVPYFSSHLLLSSRLDVLCSVTRGDKVDFEQFVDPLVLLKQQYNLHDYHSDNSPEAIQTFIQNKTKYFKRLQENPEGCISNDNEPPSLAKILKKIKNTDIMSDLEVELRNKLMELQEEYREKQSKLTRMKSPRKKLKKKGHHVKRLKRTPKKLSMTPKRRNSASPAPIMKVEANSCSPIRAPPRLEPSSPPRLQSSSVETWKQSSALLKPPKLTASFALKRPSGVTNLSTISAKFMKGKPSPFANLMKLAATGSSSATSPVKSMPDIEEGEENEADVEDHEEADAEESESESDDDEYTFKVSKTLSPEGRGRSPSNEDLSSSKKRKADKPKKQSGTTETIVPKKPKNLFMMNCYDFESGFMPKENEATSTGSTPANSADKKNTQQQPQQPPAQQQPQQQSPVLPKTEKKPMIKAEFEAPAGGGRKLRDSRLTEHDLVDGLKLLILQEGRFWPARLNSTQLPDVYGIVMEKQRGNRPQILPRDDILREAIFEVKPEAKYQLPLGTRVCVYWSRAYNCLFPGTIEELDDVVIDKENMVQVLLDDGDRRQVDISSVRMLPQNYSHVDYDPDPIATLRKRRISADSLDSGSHRETMHSLMSIHVPGLTSPLAKSSTSNLESSKRSKVEKHKHKKKKKHHHCKRKHKRQQHRSSPTNEEDDSLKIKLDGSFNNTTTYSIRSPMYHNRSEESNHEDEEEENEEEEEESTDESESDSDADEAGKQASTSKGNKSRGINPVTGRPLWHWADEGYRRPGSKGKAKKLFHRSIARAEERLNVGDCAVFLSTARVDRPYIGQVELLWETWNGNMMVKVKWFYHPEEIETTGGTVDLRVPGGLFQSPHTDENDVQTISHKCSVLPLKEYSRLLISDPVKRKKIYTSSDTYYLAGSYDPTAMTVNFQPGVLRH